MLGNQFANPISLTLKRQFRILALQALSTYAYVSSVLVCLTKVENYTFSMEAFEINLKNIKQHVFLTFIYYIGIVQSSKGFFRCINPYNLILLINLFRQNFKL